MDVPTVATTLMQKAKLFKLEAEKNSIGVLERQLVNQATECEELITFVRRMYSEGQSLTPSTLIKPFVKESIKITSEQVIENLKE